jgi:rRNA-processing protein CGR1
VSGGGGDTVSVSVSGSVLRERPVRTLAALSVRKESWDVKQRRRQEVRAAREKAKAIREAQLAEHKAEKQRIAQKRAQRAVNERRAEVVQPIADSKKIKKMRKRDLRLIQKRDTNDMM